MVDEQLNILLYEIMILILFQQFYFASYYLCQLSTKSHFLCFVFWFLVVKKKSPCIVQKTYVTCLEIELDFVRLLLQRNADSALAYRTHSPRLNVYFPLLVLLLKTHASFEH